MVRLEIRAVAPSRQLVGGRIDSGHRTGPVGLWHSRPRHAAWIGSRAAGGIQVGDGHATSPIALDLERAREGDEVVLLLLAKADRKALVVEVDDV
jgi:hypothetical protein